MSNLSVRSHNDTFTESTPAQQYESYQKRNSLKQAFIAAASLTISAATNITLFQTGFEVTSVGTAALAMASTYCIFKTLISSKAPTLQPDFSNAISNENKKIVNEVCKNEKLDRALFIQEQSVPIAAINGDKLLLNQQRFNKYNRDAKAYIIGHELSHFINADSEKMSALLLSIGLPNIAMIGASLIESNTALMSLGLTVTGVQTLLYKAYSRQIEERADVHAVLINGGLKNAKAFFNNKPPPIPRPSFLSSIFYGRRSNDSLLYDPTQLLKTHPSGAASKKAINATYGCLSS